MTTFEPRNDEAETVTQRSRWTVTETIERLRSLLQQRGLRLFTAIDQREEARKVGLELRETVLVLFGSPRAGTAVMQAAPLSALDLPLKLLIWADGEQTKVSYLNPAALSARYSLPPELAANLAGITVIADALTAERP